MARTVPAGCPEAACAGSGAPHRLPEREAAAGRGGPQSAAQLPNDAAVCARGAAGPGCHHAAARRCACSTSSAAARSFLATPAALEVLAGHERPPGRCTHWWDRSATAQWAALPGITLIPNPLNPADQEAEGAGAASFTSRKRTYRQDGTCHKRTCPGNRYRGHARARHPRRVTTVPASQRLRSGC